MQFEQACDYILKRLEQELPAHFTYHNVLHARDVYEACTRLAGLEKIGDADRQLLLTAACYHDSGFLIRVEEHEEESCRIAMEVLPQFDYTTGQIQRICGMIRATRVPQRPCNQLEYMIADADLDYLGRDDFDEISDKLLHELKWRNVMNDEDWNETQVRFLEAHHYFTQSAINLRNAKKEANLNKIKAAIDKLHPE